MALLRIRVTPRVKGKVSPFKVVYGKAYPMSLSNITGDQMHIKGQADVKEYLISLSHTLSSLHRYLNQKASLLLDKGGKDLTPCY